MNRSQWIGVLIVGMSLGTAWAVRGQFGHEQGAAWAGGIGALALVLMSQRTDWYRKLFPIAMVSAIGWGVTGMISYGRVVGFGRSNDFPNVFYGLLMLFVIGGLFGLLGGGLTGLCLESSEKKKVKWASLMAEVVAGGLISYGFLVQQIGVLMTPPRSEAWAFCLGGGLAMLWYMARNGFNSSLRVALFTAFGAGFGFAFGNFLQTVGTVLQIQFNMWNVMEYSIGFFGGTAMAYTVLTSEWPKTEQPPKRWENQSALFFLVAFIPLIVFRESIQYSHLVNRFGDIQNVEHLANLSSWIAAFVLVVGIFSAWFFFVRKAYSGEKNRAKYLFAGYLAVYIFMSYVVTGVSAGQFHLNHHLYVVNFIVIFLLLSKVDMSVAEIKVHAMHYGKYRLLFLSILLFIALLALVSISIHDELAGAQQRFPV
ncbi:hypothetical protein SAMN05444274_104417 [Mariniphaga anaerophila]|uniref:Uncharacterized protein n=1 Tax=Mariniphaga anaerophila TaxID=1484053 RepID=A0A1M5APK4_9BACT|nr:hypothetical protein [Mariniphaga anaerophila]SHF32169.1 hypothetical protein SAMN05444274_104417 [Mariniphaga anaerophila]